MLCFHLNKSICNFYSLLDWIFFHIPSLPFLFKLSKLLNSFRIKRMYAIHLSVTYNVMSDVLSSFQTKTLLVSGAYMKIWPERQWNGGVSLDRNPKNDPRDGRNFGIFLTFIQWTSAPHFAPLVCDLQCFSPSPFFCLVWTAWLPVRFILTDVFLSGKSSLKAANISAWELFHLESGLEILFFLPQIAETYFFH